jgi:GntR family transcriptional repressor for pyruvate dehydrogenase complex
MERRFEMLKAVEKRKAYEDIVKQIRDLIEAGKMKKGDQLPTERELTETFKVSRATVREAIRTLESLRLVESRQGNGTYVLASSEEALLQPLTAALFHEKDDLIDIFYIRRVIEPYVAQLAAENATRQEIRELEEIIQKQEQDLGNGKNIIDSDSAFHNLLARMAKKRVLQRLLLALVDLLAETREEYLQNDIRAKESLQGHQKVFSAIQRGDCAAARQAMVRHLEGVEALVFKKKGGGGKCE